MDVACGFLESSQPINFDVYLQHLPSQCFTFYADTPGSALEDPITLDASVQWAWLVVFWNPRNRLTLMCTYSIYLASASLFTPTHLVLRLKMP